MTTSQFGAIMIVLIIIQLVSVVQFYTVHERLDEIIPLEDSDNKSESVVESKNTSIGLADGIYLSTPNDIDFFLHDENKPVIDVEWVIIPMTDDERVVLLRDIQLTTDMIGSDMISDEKSYLKVTGMNELGYYESDEYSLQDTDVSIINGITHYQVFLNHNRFIGHDDVLGIINNSVVKTENAEPILIELHLALHDDIDTLNRLLDIKNMTKRIYVTIETDEKSRIRSSDAVMINFYGDKK